MSTPIENTYEGIVLVENIFSAPNDDVNTGAPRIDPVTGKAMTTAESCRRKLRNYFEAKFEYKSPYDVLMRSENGLIRSDGEHYTIQGGFMMTPV